MAVVQLRSKRKPSGGRYKSVVKKVKANCGSLPAFTKVGSRKVKVVRTRGGSVKERLLSVDVVNVFVPSKNSFVKAEVKNVVENPANRHFVRRNIITKGAVIETSVGKARVVSRPGQEGVVNAVLLE